MFANSDQEYACAVKAKAGCDRSKKRMIEANLRMVLKWAHYYASSNSYVEMEDLFQEGVLGLSRAVEKFEPDRGWKFLTYATPWIRQAMTRALAIKSRTIRLPVHLTESIHKIKKYSSSFEAKNCRKPTELEICSHLELTLKQYKHIVESNRRPISLDKCIGQEEDMALDQIIGCTDTNHDRVHQDISGLRADLAYAMKVLQPIERTVLQLYSGIYSPDHPTHSGTPLPIEQLAQAIGESRERTCTIKAKALRKLRYHHRYYPLNHWLEA